MENFRLLCKSSTADAGKPGNVGKWPNFLPETSLYPLTLVSYSPSQCPHPALPIIVSPQAHRAGTGGPLLFKSTDYATTKRICLSIALNGWTPNLLNEIQNQTLLDTGPPSFLSLLLYIPVKYIYSRQHESITT